MFLWKSTSVLNTEGLQFEKDEISEIASIYNTKNRICEYSSIQFFDKLKSPFSPFQSLLTNPVKHFLI